MSDADTGVDDAADTPMTGESLEALRSKIVARVMDDVREYVAQVVRPDVDQNAAAVTDLQQRVDELEQQNEKQRAELDAVSSIADGSRATPTERALRLATRLRNVAEERAGGDGPGLVSWTYSDVQDHLEGDGLGRVHAPQAYAAMEEVAESCTGYRVTQNDDGQKVIRVNSARLPSERPVNEIKKAGPEGPPESDHDTTTTVGDN